MKLFTFPSPRPGGKEKRLISVSFFPNSRREGPALKGILLSTGTDNGRGAKVTRYNPCHRIRIPSRRSSTYYPNNIGNPYCSGLFSFHMIDSKNRCIRHTSISEHTRWHSLYSPNNFRSNKEHRYYYFAHTELCKMKTSLYCLWYYR